MHMIGLNVHIKRGMILSFNPIQDHDQITNEPNIFQIQWKSNEDNSSYLSGTIRTLTRTRFNQETCKNDQKY